jgi:hypothetical protein
LPGSVQDAISGKSNRRNPTSKLAWAISVANSWLRSGGYLDAVLMYRLPGWIGTGYNATGATNVPRTVEIVANQMVVLDEAITETAPGGMGFNS